MTELEEELKHVKLNTTIVHHQGEKTRKKDEQEMVLGYCGIVVRNEKVEVLNSFLLQHKLYAMDPG